MKSEKGFIEIFLVITVIILLVTVIALIGMTIYENVSYGEKEGTIIKKYYQEPYITTSYVMSGKIMVPITNRHSEIWNFKLQKEVEGKTKTITIEVAQDIYDKYNIGDYFEESK